MTDNNFSVEIQGNLTRTPYIDAQNNLSGTRQVCHILELEVEGGYLDNKFTEEVVLSGANEDVERALDELENADPSDIVAKHFTPQKSLRALSAAETNLEDAHRGRVRSALRLSALAGLGLGTTLAVVVNEVVDDAPSDAPHIIVASIGLVVGAVCARRAVAESDKGIYDEQAVFRSAARQDGIILTIDRALRSAAEDRLTKGNPEPTPQAPEVA